MRFLMLVTMAVLGLLAPTEAMTIQDKLQSLSARLSSDAFVLGGCGTASNMTACKSHVNCHWVTQYTPNVCLQKTGHKCIDYTTPKGCEQHGNPCIWHDVQGSKPKCIEAPVLDSCGKLSTSTACSSVSTCYWATTSSNSHVCLLRAGQACEKYVSQNGCTQKGNKCTWYVEDGKQQCIKGPKLPCHEYGSYKGCEQVGNNGECVWYHHESSAKCLPRNLLYQPFVFDCTGTHNSVTGYDSTKNRNKAECDEEPVKHYCQWDAKTNQCQPRAATTHPLKPKPTPKPHF